MSGIRETSRIVDADLIIDMLKLKDHFSVEDEFAFEVIDEINKYAEDFVRCKDCKFRYGEDSKYNPNDIVCTYWETDGMTEKDFCSQGERRGG